MTATASDSRHLRWIEAARTGAMREVVWAHASNTAFFRKNDFFVIPLFSASLITVAVPTFFMRSGYLLSLHAWLRLWTIKELREGKPFKKGSPLSRSPRPKVSLRRVGQSPLG